MRMRKPLAGVVLLAGAAMAAGVLTAPIAAADPYGNSGGSTGPTGGYVPQTYTCTGQDWGGHQLPPVSFTYQSDPSMAARRALTEWRGKAKYSTIVCNAS
ncbi:hypothetical protein [Nocardia alni]|uniref:hypothetical protein n=1 Tax=Nocardia alni TaxID=2815723 RepID=UPI001C22FF4D|nr:hypothetical protein [Nocardia alni]